MRMGVFWLVVSILAVAGMALLLRLVRMPPAAEPEVELDLRGTPPDPSWRDRPAPGEIWRTPAGRRCLVLRTFADHLDVLEIEMAGDELVETVAGPRSVDDAALATKEGTAEPDIWARVQRSHRTGYPT